jgi:hypothetical protein
MYLLSQGLLMTSLLIGVISVANHKSEDPQKVGELLERRVKVFGDAILGFTNIEQIYSNDTTVSFLNFTVWNHLNDIVHILEERLHKIVGILKDNKNLIEKAYESNDVKAFKDGDLCCNVDSSDLELDLQFNRLVSKAICYMKSDSVAGESVDRNFASVFRENSEKSMFLLWQYFGDSAGNYFQYPAKKSPCDGKAWNDPRFL